MHTIVEKALQGEEGHPRVEPVVETEEVGLDLSRPDRVVKVRTWLPADLRGWIIQVIRNYRDIFAWAPRTCRASIERSSPTS